MSNNSNNSRVSASGRSFPAWWTDLSVPVPTPGRATRVASWIGWHLPELAGVTAPAVVAVAVSPWALLVSGVVGAGWRVHTVRSARELAALNAGHGAAAVTAESSDVDTTRDGPAPDTGVVDADVVAGSGDGGSVDGSVDGGVVRRSGGVA
ncbi:MAG: hypothetical protein WBA97_24725 [Actinophytocola sp.]|uniref:hypothetical protein n=1 Tax=Actinophytocola sp. TaxID=1872138 RepID=UPI003C76B27E